MNFTSGLRGCRGCSNHPIILKTLNFYICQCYSHVAFTLYKQQISLKFSTKQQGFDVVTIIKKNCLRVLASSLQVISAMTRNPLSVIQQKNLQMHADGSLSRKTSMEIRKYVCNFLALNLLYTVVVDHTLTGSKRKMLFYLL